MEFPIKFDTVESEWSIIYFEGSQVIIFENIVFFSLKIDLKSKQTVQTLMKCRIMRHFIRVFTVCQSTLLGVFGIRKNNRHFINMFYKYSTYSVNK